MKEKKDRLDIVFDAMDEKTCELAIENRFPYIFSKAESFLRLGAEKYRKGDFFQQPPANFTEEDIALLKDGCEQILNAKGLTEENPFQNLDVSGFNALMRMFHFEPFQRSTKYQSVIEGKKGCLDKITFKHVMDETEVTYFNFCLYSV
jgi:hypothetical protein